MVWCLEHSKKYGEALVYCDRALKIEPNYVYAMSYKAKLLLLLKDYEGSLHWYDKVLEIEPNDQRAIFHRYKVVVELDKKNKEPFLKKFMKL
tara:strand:- start:1140 stop:1415 length:276 start_codon:yes stop_codon:yes gene_type:complete